MPVDYHAWTHLPKEEGGTDPIVFPEGLAMPEEIWGFARNLTTATSVPDDFTVWKDMTLSDIEVAGSQSDIVVNSGTLEIGADLGGTYILTLAALAASGGGGTGDFQISIALKNAAGSITGRIPSPIVQADWGRAEERNELTRLIGIPGEQSSGRRLGVGVRCSGNAVGQTVQVNLVARRLYIDGADTDRAFVWL